MLIGNLPNVTIGNLDDDADHAAEQSQTPALNLKAPLHVSTNLITLKRGDTLPALLLTLMDGNGAVDFSAVTITAATFVLVNGETGDVLVEAELTVVNAALGQFRHNWQSDETNVPGNHQGEIQLTFSDGNIATFPDDGYFIVQILRDLVP